MSKCNGLPEAKNFSANASMELWSIKSISWISTLAIPCRFFFAFPTSLAGTMTIAPAFASVFTVSNPMPVFPPVTMAIFSENSTSLLTLIDVDVALLRDPIGFCIAPLYIVCAILNLFCRDKCRYCLFGHLGSIVLLYFVLNVVFFQVSSILLAAAGLRLATGGGSFL